jgi:ABC-type transport system involved in cytochrome c biogenesis permease subunit
VLTIVSSYGAGMLAWGLGNLSLGYYLFGRYHLPESKIATKKLAPGFQPAKRDDESDLESDEPHVKSAPVECHSLAGFIYKTFQVAVLLLAAGTILGGLWADVSWGRFWGWDPKEVWALISLLTYLAILHGRFAGWIGDFGLAIGSVLGASAIVFSWYGVNFYLGVGLHSYGFGAGGQWEVLSGVVINWLFAGAAGIRYYLETRTDQPVQLRWQ